MTSDRTAVEARLHEKHDYTVAELNDLREAHEGLRAVVRAFRAEVAQSILIQQRLYARLSGVLGEAEGRPRGAPSAPTPAQIEAGKIHCVCGNSSFRDCPKHFPEG